MKSFVCVLFLSVLIGLYASVIDNETNDDHKTAIMNLLNKSPYQVKKIKDNLSENKKLTRVRRSATKIHKKGCDRKLSMASTGIGGAAGAGVGAATGAALGSFVPVIGTGIGALLGNVFSLSKVMNQTTKENYEVSLNTHF